MSWIARSLVNTLRGNEDDDEDNPESKEKSRNQSNKASIEGNEEDEDDDDPTRGVKEDLTELTKTLTRQIWGVASFLAPTPSTYGQRSDPAGPMVSDEPEIPNSPRLAGIRGDLAEIGGRFRTGISMLSKTTAVSEISKIASSLLPFGSEEEEEGEESEEIEEKYEGGAVGITDEVLAFAMNISMHPETWLDFPLIPDEDDTDDFDMSDAQQEHALAVERFAPRLAALRIELCPSHMSEGHFWKIYFVLLHSRLNRQDAELLTTPQIVQARAMLLQDLHNRTKPNSEGSGRGASFQKVVVTSEENVASSSSHGPPESSVTKTITVEEATTSVPITYLETEKHPDKTTDVKIIDKSVIEEDPRVQARSMDLNIDVSNAIPIQKYEEDGDDWLEEEEAGEASGCRGANIPLGNEEEVSFSDLEDDDDQGEPKNSETINRAVDSQPKDSREGWVQLNKGSEDAAKGGNSTISQNKESNDWLSVDDIEEEL